jgi:hypothetical protein
MGLNKNYCRNPDGFKEGLWCPTIGVADADGDFGLCDPMAASDYISFELGFERLEGDNSYKSTTKVQDDFINTNPTACPASFGIELANGDSISAAGSNGGSKGGTVSDWISIDGDGYISIGEANYKGGDFGLRVYSFTAFNEKVYKSLTITEICIKQTVDTGAADSFALEAVETGDGGDVN